MGENKGIAYFSMEFGIRNDMPTFSGGLGMLAGDHVKSAADLGVDLTGIGLMYHQGYFDQRIQDKKQHENYPRFHPDKLRDSSGKHLLQRIPETVSVDLYGHDVVVGAWKYEQVGRGGNVPLLFLTTDMPGNNPLDLDITATLYGGDDRTRIAQEAILGIGGIRMLDKLGINPSAYHLNEGHGALAGPELRRRLGNEGKERTVFTTHTPVPAGHDRFNYCLAYETLWPVLDSDIRELAGNDELNMTTLALSLSSRANGVSLEHSIVSKELLGRDIGYVTNGVHSFTWTSKHFQKLYDQHIPEWRDNPCVMENAIKKIPTEHFIEARKRCKMDLVHYIKNVTGTCLDPSKPIISFARRFAPYKRADLLFHDMDRLLEIADHKAQFVFAGKAHPRDSAGKELIAKVNRIAQASKDSMPILFLPGYDMNIGKLMTSGSDVWLNTPVRPKEASGTSGMKAAHNGVPHLSTVDGWQFEVPKGFGSWEIGERPTDFALRDNYSDYEKDSNSLYDLLEHEVIPAMSNPKAAAKIGLEAVVNAGFFNTGRMVTEYRDKVYPKLIG